MNKLAKICRVITVPTVLFLIMLLTTYFVSTSFVNYDYEFYIPLALIGFFPIVAYIVSFIVRKVKKQDKDGGRKLQRKLAFVFSLIGYVSAFVLSLALNFNSPIKELTSRYFFTVAFLTVFNLCHIKASGHASGIVGPMLLLCHYLGWIYIIPCIAVYALSFWSSIYLKRHTVAQFAIGTLCAASAFVLSILIF